MRTICWFAATLLPFAALAPVGQQLLQDLPRALPWLPFVLGLAYVASYALGQAACRRVPWRPATIATLIALAQAALALGVGFGAAFGFSLLAWSDPAQIEESILVFAAIQGLLTLPGYIWVLARLHRRLLGPRARHDIDQAAHILGGGLMLLAFVALGFAFRREQDALVVLPAAIAAACVHLAVMGFADWWQRRTAG